jgi:hypothetical protein
MITRGKHSPMLDGGGAGALGDFPQAEILQGDDALTVRTIEIICSISTVQQTKPNQTAQETCERFAVILSFHS